MIMRAERIAGFLTAHGWGDAARTPILGDASFRRYERLTKGDATRVLMDAPPPQEDVRPFVALDRYLIGLGLSAPRIHAADEEAGLLLLEDFGAYNMARPVDDPATAAAEKERLYTLALDTLIALHRHPDAAAAPAPAFDEARFLREVSTLLDWYLPAATGNGATKAMREDYLDAWRKIIPVARRAPDSLVLFDFFPDNLMALEARDGVAACGLLDFQDGVIGPATYDLVSLLEDARRDVTPELQAKLMARYLAAFPALDREGFAASYAAMGAQRNTRILGVFTRLRLRDKKSGYLRYIPRVWRHVENSLKHPALAPVKGWMDRHLPPAQRRTPTWDTPA